jgi:hypothetical protein
MRAVRIAAFLFLLVLPAFGQEYTIQQYLNIKSAGSPSMSPDGREVAYLSNATGTMQVWATLISSPKPVQLTNYDDNVSFVKLAQRRQRHGVWQGQGRRRKYAVLLDGQIWRPC